MSILVIPEITNPLMTRAGMFKVEEGINRLEEGFSVANLYAWSVFAPYAGDDKDTSLDVLSKGYYALSLSPAFLSFDVYIGFLLKQDFEEVDTIIYTSEAAKQIFETRFVENTLPKAREELIIEKDMSVENEVFKRLHKGI